MAIATIIGAIIGILVFYSGPRTEVTASYRVSPFIVPDMLLKEGHLDTVIARQDTLLLKLYNALLSRLLIEQRIAIGIKDSLNPYYLKSFETEGRVESFASKHRSLCILTIKNEGDKSLNPLQVIVSPTYYGLLYEYTDSDGHLQKGKAAGKFSIGDLAPTETREVHVWGIESTFDNGVTLVFPDGKVQAERPEEVTGKMSWLVRNWFNLIPFLVMIITPIIVIVVARAQMKRSRVAFEAAQQQEDTSEN